LIRHVVEIVPLEFTDENLLAELAEHVSGVFPFECRVGEAGILPVATLDESRGQYDASRILRYLDASNCSSFRLLGVTGVDLFTPILRYLFGEAMLGGRVALVSVHRLGVASNRIGGDPAARSMYIERVVKECIHELGHTFDLRHCDDPACVMASSLDIDRIHANSTKLCSYCSVMLQDAIGR